MYKYIAHARNGIIAENLETKKRKPYGLSSKMTSLYDISIYTSEEELRLQKVFENIREYLAKGNSMPDAKADDKQITAFFSEVLPNYDPDRFFVSHMKKVINWYNYLETHASLDFVDHEADKNVSE